jgi:hypothetical protein
LTISTKQNTSLQSIFGETRTQTNLYREATNQGWKNLGFLKKISRFLGLLGFLRFLGFLGFKVRSSKNCAFGKKFAFGKVARQATKWVFKKPKFCTF